MYIKKEFKVKKFTLLHEDREKFSKPIVSLHFYQSVFVVKNEKIIYHSICESKSHLFNK